MLGNRIVSVASTALFCCSFALAASADRFESEVKPFLKSNCVMCHQGESASGGLDLNRFLGMQAGAALAFREQWERISVKLQSGQMPPPGSERPPVEQVAAVRAWVETEYARLDRLAKPNPGRVTARRLNRYEYNNTILDLLGVDFHPADDFPADDSGYGFDSIGDVLTVSPALLQKYLHAAETIASTVTTVDQRKVQPTVVRYLAERIGQYPSLREAVTHKFAADGEYSLRSPGIRSFRTACRSRGSFTWTASLPRT